MLKKLMVQEKSLAEVQWLLIEPWNSCCVLRRTPSYPPDNHKLRQEGSCLLKILAHFLKKLLGVLY